MKRPIGILFNPISGDGKAAQIAVGAAERMLDAGVKTELRESKREYEGDEAEAMLERFSALLIVGGDGTLRPLLPSLAAARLPVYMFAAGNESLFARHFNMKRSCAHFLSLVERNQPSEHYFALVDGQPFFSMVSLGLDSEVIAALAKTRTGTIGHRGYLIPTLSALMRHVPPRISLEADGKALVEAECGYLNIANSPEYARGLNPVPEAASSSGELHAAFYPCSSKRFYLSWLRPLLLGKPVSTAERRLFTGKSFKISTSGASFPVQADGECIGATPVHVVLSTAKFLVL